MPGEGDVTLYAHWTCPYANRVEFALAQRGIPFHRVAVPPSAVRPAGFVLPPEFVAHSPKREIPLVRIGEEYRADSIPILEWLETAFADEPLLPADPSDRRLVRERVGWVDGRLFPAMMGILYGREETIGHSAGALGARLAEMDGWLAHSDWLGGDSPTLVEATMIALYLRLDGLRQLGFRDDLPERVAGHLSRCRRLAGWAAVAWIDEQGAELVGRFRKLRRIRSQAGPN